MTATASLCMINIDCASPPVLADFYRQLLDWKVTHSQDEYAMVSDGTTSIGFGRVDGYQPPRWPDPDSPKRYHLDLYVDDLAQGRERALELGASEPAFQPGGERYLVLLDPAGQPFCICLRQ